MPISVIVGGQFGSEGKGKVAYEIAKREKVKFAIRVGGTNSGHTVVTDTGQVLILRQLPTPVLLPGVVALLPAGSYIKLDVLLEEIRSLAITPKQLRIHPNACVLTGAHAASETKCNLFTRLGSTESGVGAALLERIARTGEATFARDCVELSPYVEDYTHHLRGRLQAQERVLIEGTQGFGLSLLHSPHYPFVTSRDTTAASFLSEAGLSPLDVDDVVLVIRAFPIRVSGNSGPLPNEITWDVVQAECNSTTSLIEFTSVTKRVRRVARFDSSIVKLAIAYNNPSRIVLNHVDYIDSRAVNGAHLSSSALAFIEGVEREIGRSVTYIGTSNRELHERVSSKNLKVYLA